MITVTYTSSDNSCDVHVELSLDVVSSMRGLLTDVDEKHEVSWLVPKLSDQGLPECSQGNTWVPEIFNKHDDETQDTQHNKIFPAHN